MAIFSTIRSSEDVLRNNLQNSFEKGKGLPEGTIKEWGGKKYQKKGGQWIEVGKEKIGSGESGKSMRTKKTVEVTGERKKGGEEEKKKEGSEQKSSSQGGGVKPKVESKPKGEEQKKTKKEPQDYAKATPSEHLHKYLKDGKDEGLKKVAKQELQGRGEINKEPTKNKAFHGKTVELKGIVDKLGIGGDLGKLSLSLRDHLKNAEHAFASDNLEEAALHLSQAEYDSKKLDKLLDSPQTGDIMLTLTRMNDALDQKLYGKKGKEGVFKGEKEKLTYMGKKIASLPFDQAGREEVKRIVGNNLHLVENMGSADMVVLNAGLQYENIQNQNKKEKSGKSERENKEEFDFKSDKKLSFDQLEEKYQGKTSKELKKISSQFKKKMDKFAQEFEAKGEEDKTYVLASEDSFEWREMNSYYNKLSELEFRAEDREALSRGEVL